jgi:hypothetical protein
MSYNYRRRADRQGSIAIDEDGQAMTGGFLPPRNQVQYITTTPSHTEQKMVFQFSSGDTSSNGSVKNDSQYAIKRIVARDVDGRYWIGADLQRESSVKLSPSDKAGLQKIVGQDLLPSPSQFFVPELQHNNYYGRTNRAGIQANLLEQRLKRWCLGSMPKNSFVATAELDESVLGVSNAKVLDSVHLIMGDIP